MVFRVEIERDDGFKIVVVKVGGNVDFVMDEVYDLKVVIVYVVYDFFFKVYSFGNESYCVDIFISVLFFGCVVNNNVFLLIILGIFVLKS